MTAARLREAAALMRERAEAVEIPWHPYGDESLPERSTAAEFMHDMQGYLGGSWGDHAGSWHPDVALAVADWLDEEAERFEKYGSKVVTTKYSYTPVPTPVPYGTATNSVDMYIDPASFENVPPEPDRRALAIADAYLSTASP